MQNILSWVLPIKHLPYNRGNSPRALIPPTLSITITGPVGIVLQYQLTIFVVEKAPVSRPPKPMSHSKPFAGLVNISNNH